MTIDESGYTISEGSEYVPPTKSVEDGAGGGDMDMWELDDFEIIQKMAIGDVTNNSSYDTPSGVSDVANREYQVNQLSENAVISELSSPDHIPIEVLGRIVAKDQGNKSFTSIYELGIQTKNGRISLEKFD